MSSTTLSPTAPLPATLRPSPTRADLALTVIVTIAGLVLANFNYTDGPSNSAADGGPVIISAWAVPTFVLLTLPLLWRTRAPITALGAITAGTLIHWAAFGEMIHCGVAYPAVALLAYAAGRRLQGGARLLGLGLSAAAAVVVGATDHLGVETLVVGLPLALVGFGLGVAVAAGAARKAQVPHAA